MYRVESGDLWYDDQKLGKADQIYVDCNQSDIKQITEAEDVWKVFDYEGILRTRLPVGDYVFVTREGKIVVVEEKTSADLVTSWPSRRLQRQLRHGFEVADISVLGIRGDIISSYWFGKYEGLWLDLIKYQMLGGRIGFLPYDAPRIMRALIDWRAMLVPSQSTLSIIAGTDRRKLTGDMRPSVLGLRRLIKGCGDKTASQLVDVFGTDIVGILSRTEEELKAAGANKVVVQRIKELRGG